MKREILFRGKRVDNGEWVEGLLHFNAAESSLQITEFVQTSPTMSDPCGDQFNLFHNINPDTVSQFTGLTDKNGKRIFEGDVLGGCNGSINGHGWEQKPILIKFSEGRFNVPLWAAKGEWDSTHYLVVIGNTHDNPELL